MVDFAPVEPLKNPLVPPSCLSSTRSHGRRSNFFSAVFGFPVKCVACAVWPVRTVKGVCGVARNSVVFVFCECQRGGEIRGESSLLRPISSFRSQNPFSVGPDQGFVVLIASLPLLFRFGSGEFSFKDIPTLLCLRTRILLASML